MKKLKLRKVKGLVQGHTASMEWGQDSNLGSQSHGLPFPLHPAAAAKSRQSCLTLCDPIDSSPPGSTVPGILQARTLELVPLPSPMRESEKRKGSRSVMPDS